MEIKKKNSLLAAVSALWRKHDSQGRLTFREFIEKITCALDVMDTLVKTEVALHGMSDPKEICEYVMKQICDFYDADYVGILEGDLDMGNWFFKWWYRKGEEGVDQLDKANLALPAEFIHPAPTWVKAFKKNDVIFIKNTDQVKETSPSEYALYQRLKATSVIGCPFYMHSTGFVVVKNPRRYYYQHYLLRMFTYVLMMELNEYKLINSIQSNAAFGDDDENDYRMNIFNGIQISHADETCDHDAFAPEEIELLTYLAIRDFDRVVSARNLEGLVWEGKNATDGQKARHAISGIRRRHRMLSDNQFIETAGKGYRFNSECNVKIDIQEFLKLESFLSMAYTDKEKIRILKKIIKLYDGPILLTKDSPSWMDSYQHHFQNRYLKNVNHLLKLYYENQDYESLHKYAEISMVVIPNNEVGFYWKLKTYNLLGDISHAQSLMDVAENALPDETFERLKKRLEEFDDEDKEGTYDSEYDPNH